MCTLYRQSGCRTPLYALNFTSFWQVPPGGSIEAGDGSLLEAGLRELREEVNIDIPDSQVKDSTPLCLWESVYPTSLERGQPQRQHCVVYFHIKVEQSHGDMDVQMDPQEVGAFAWLDSDHVDAALEQSAPETCRFAIHGLNSDGSQSVTFKPATLLSTRYDPSVSDSGLERLSSGTLFALQQWTSKCRRKEHV